MRRRQGITALVAGALVVIALLGAFAVGISAYQSQARRGLERSAHQRTVLVANLIDAVFEQQARIGLDARATLIARHVRVRDLSDELGAKRYAALIDSRGRVLAETRGFDALDRVDLAPAAMLAMLAGGRTWAVSDVRPGGVINVISRIAAPGGDRFLITGVPRSTMSQFVTGELRKVPGVTAQHQLILDGQGVVIGSTVADRPAGYVFHTAAQQAVLREPAGIAHGANGVRYFDSVPLASSRWKLLISVPVGTFFASVSGLRHWLPWIIFAAFGIVACAVLVLVERAIGNAARIRLANARLSASNDELAGAQSRLQEANVALERSNVALERQAHELVRSNSELDQFASIASHDLQEPLRKVRTFTERVSEFEAGNLSERGSDYLARANAAAERMQTLIEDLLRYSRVSATEEPFAPVDLAAVAAAVLDDLSEQIASAGAQVRLGPLPTINADAGQLRQLLQNLVSNALKFRLEGREPVVSVAAEVAAGWMTLTVSDNGIGFDPRYRQRIFRVFERLHGRGTYPGTGIGLALCRKIAERHGGTIEAEGVAGEGATFTVTMQTERSVPVGESPASPPAESTAIPEEPYVAA